MNINIIVASTPTGGIGFKGELPWKGEAWSKEDLKRFKQTTTGHGIVMGWVTFKEIVDMSPSGKVLPNRVCYVVAHNTPEAIETIERAGAHFAPCVTEAFERLSEHGLADAFVIGGVGLFVQALSFAQRVFLTVIRRDYETDRTIPVDYISSHFTVNHNLSHKSEVDPDVAYTVWDRVR